MSSPVIKRGCTSSTTWLRPPPRRAFCDRDRRRLSHQVSHMGDTRPAPAGTVSRQSHRRRNLERPFPRKPGFRLPDDDSVRSRNVEDHSYRDAFHGTYGPRGPFGVVLAADRCNAPRITVERSAVLGHRCELCSAHRVDVRRTAIKSGAAVLALLVMIVSRTAEPAPGRHRHDDGIDENTQPEDGALHLVPLGKRWPAR